MWFTGLWSRIDMRVPFKILTPVLALASVAEMNGELYTERTALDLVDDPSPRRDHRPN